MPTCKALLAKGAATALLCLAQLNGFSQTAPQAPAAPTAPTAPASQGGLQPVQPITSGAPGVSMPSMPWISAPVAGSSFYTPGKRWTSQNENSSQQKQNQESQGKKSAASADLENSLLGGGVSDFSNLTAQDLVQLAQRGSISSVSSLLGYSSFNRSASSSGAADNQILLKKILSELEEIKKAQGSSLTAAATGTKPSALPPKILRFAVNANDILSNCVQVYFSDLESDGSFLLTGDARSLFENQSLTETFYLLFKASGTQNSKTVYTVTPSLSQSKECPTPLSKFCASQTLTASRVGNLVTLKAMQEGLVGDLLLDIGNVR